MELPTVNRRIVNWITHASSHDFCPWANHYVYWLKEPVGWFVLATLTSLLVGAFLSPLGWTVAAGLVAILLLGLGFPWLATRSVTCQVRPVRAELYEREESSLELVVRNRLPIPLAGLRIEGYLSLPPAEQEQDSTSIVANLGLAGVPALSCAKYRLPITPEYRGRYPVEPPWLACAFPFGIWTARRTIKSIKPVVVWPLIIPILSEFEVAGGQLAEVGFGQRATVHGDFLGVRHFQRGDSLKSIHWVQSAKLDSLVVCERGGPQQQPVEIRLSTSRGLGTASAARENLAWRVRVAGSLIDLFTSRHLPFRLLIDDQLQAHAFGVRDGRHAWTVLADVPLDPPARQSETHKPTNTAASANCIVISAQSADGSSLTDDLVRVDIQQLSRGFRRHSKSDFCLLNLDQDITSQLNHLLMEALRGNQAA